MCHKCEKILINKLDKRPWKEQSQDFELCYSSCIDNITNCICGVNIKYKHYIKNKITGNIYILGSICINNYNKKDKNKNGVFNNNKSISDKIKELQKTNCDICNKMVINIDNHKKSKKHINKELEKKRLEEIEIQRLEELKNNYRECVSCKKYNIEIKKPKYYKFCLECYKKKINNYHNNVIKNFIFED